MIHLPHKRQSRPLSADDKAFFQSFYEEYKGFLFYIANQYAAVPEDREDIVQDAILRLISNISSLKDLSSGAAAKYIALTVRAAYLDAEKRKSNTQEIPTEDHILEQLLDQDPLSGRDPSGTQLRELKQNLSARDWMVLEGKYIQGYTQEELGQLIGVSPDSIRMILHRARTKAKKLLLKEHGGEGHA